MNQDRLDKLGVSVDVRWSFGSSPQQQDKGLSYFKSLFQG